MLARYLLSSCVRLCPSQAFIVSKWLDVELVLAWKLNSFHLSHNVIKKFGYLQKLRYFPWNFIQNSGLGKFSHGKSIASSTKLVVVVDGRACWRRLYDSWLVVAVNYKSGNCNPLTPSLRFVVDLLYNLFYSWQDFDWHSAPRCPSLLSGRLV